MRVLAVVGVMMFATAARAEDVREEAKRHFASGESFYRAGDYKAAIAEFREADKLVPSPILAFNMGLCHEKLGEGDQAIALYKTYLERRPDAPNRTQVEGRIARLETEAKKKPATPELYQELDDTAAAPATTPPADGAPAPAAAPPSDDPFVRRIPGRAPGAAAAAPAGGPPGSAATTSASAPPPRPQGPPQGARQTPPPEPEKPAKKSKPLYKEWWFWVVIGVSAIILIDIATTDDSSSNNAAITPVNSGATLFRF
jgi:Tfp pilus assembly protein PilF